MAPRDTQVQMPGGVPVGCGFTTGHDDETLALGLEHTCQTPTGCRANWDQCVKEGEWVGTQRGSTMHQKFQGIEVRVYAFIVVKKQPLNKPLALHVLENPVDGASVLAVFGWRGNAVKQSEDLRLLALGASSAAEGALGPRIAEF